MADERTVGILAYGSLISDPGSEIEEVCTRTLTDIVTPFPVEFARTSKGRGDAPTLVPHEAGKPVRALVFVVNTDVEDATNRLYRRELGAVGSGRRYKHSREPGLNKVIVEQLKRQFGLDIVLYTRIGATIRDLGATTLAQLAVESVQKSQRDRDGITYLSNAVRAGIETPLTAAYVEEVKRLTGARDLEEALAKARARVPHE